VAVAELDRAETYLRLMAETELRRALRTRPGRGSARGEGLKRLGVAAQALVAAGAIDSESADVVTAGYELALVLRHRLTGSPLRSGVFSSRRVKASTRPAGPVRAMSIGTRVPLTLDGRTAEVSLLTLTIADDRAVLTLRATPPPEPDGPDDREDDPGFLFEASATDDRGCTYHGAISFIGDDDAEWTGQLEFRPALRPGITPDRWAAGWRGARPGGRRSPASSPAA
jgi:hypothetical protein